jgi:hypothetical protein
MVIVLGHQPPKVYEHPSTGFSKWAKVIIQTKNGFS